MTTIWQGKSNVNELYNRNYSWRQWKRNGKVQNCRSKWSDPKPNFLKAQIHGKKVCSEDKKY
jgi:hypothetical protein